MLLHEWLGENKSDAELQKGFASLKNWWLHRKKGESSQAVKAIGTGVMEDMVDRYRDQYFVLAHCQLVEDGEDPPRTLGKRRKELAKARRATKMLLKKETQRELQLQTEQREQQRHYATSIGII